MFSLFAKIIRRIALYPRMVMGFFLLLTLLCIYPINRLQWQIQLQDTLKKNTEQTESEIIEKAFGGLGSLTIVVQSRDSLANFQLAETFSESLSKDSLVNFIEYAPDVEFYKRNKLLYASEDDLAQVIDYLDSLEKKTILESNPLFVDLNEKDSSRKQPVHNLKLIKEIEERHIRNLQQSFSNADGTIRVIDIYPTHSLSDLNANRSLWTNTKKIIEPIAKEKNIQVYYTGKVFESIQAGKMLLPEAKAAGCFAAVAILALLIFRFYKQPQLIFISGLPMAIPTIFTMALAFIFFGRINLFTLFLGLLLPGHACQITTHVISRYLLERENKLGPVLSVESAILGVCPTVAASSFIMAGLFISLILVPLPALQEFGILGALGCILNLSICPLIATSLLQFLQKKKMFAVLGTKKNDNPNLWMFPNKVNWTIIIVLSTLSLCGFLYSGFNLSFLYDFKQTEMQLEQKKVKELIQETGFSTYDPIILMLPDSTYSHELSKDFERLRKRGKINDLGKLYTQHQFVPQTSKHKKDQIEKLQNDLFEKRTSLDSNESF